ncbi:histidine utilization repressor [Sphingomonas flavalba]|uniref:histidine utilization repressor n=1 Tax=Sphingomonas flavalba TaxID=2559804 RepID=UPI0023B3532A|nr:histidine utilization repressor [Sphingomonas flavalba]
MTAAPSAHPLHQRIRSAIEGRIMSGALRPGDRIPYEHELMQQYGCSRMTVNKALSALADAGLIVRRRGAGSFVAQPRAHVATLIVPDVPAEIRARGMAYRLDLIDQVLLDAGDARVAAAMTVPAGSAVLAVTCRHNADGRPFAMEERLISIAEVPEAVDIDFAAVSPGSWLLAHVPWTEAEHRILARPAGDHAGALAVAADTACLVLERRTWRAKHTITWVRQTFPGAFALTARFDG